MRLACALLLALLVAPASAQFENVGVLSFPTSGSAEAQRYFLRGVAILHSFGWKQAIVEFKRAQALQPDFAMAYWGETLCYNHPLMPEQDAKTPREVLARLGATPEARMAKAPTPREQGFLRAVEALWGEGDWRARRIAYMRAMERLHRDHPTDDEVTTFYAVALLSGARAMDDETFRYEMKAGALAMDVFHRNPKHPGAPHYVIHAFDDPVHAPLALQAAHAYASIAPAVSHAIHMPTHIFIQHGMWNEVASQNTRAFQVAHDLWAPGDVPGDMAHSLDWGQYGFLQQGDYAGARKAIELFDQMAATTKHRRAASAATLSKARYIVETEEWSVKAVPEDASAETLFANGLSALRTGDIGTATQMEMRLAARAGATNPSTGSGGAHADHGGAPPPPMQAGGAEENKSPRVMQRELQGLLALQKGDQERAITLLREAVSIEESMRPPNGAADPIKPSHELLGEVLLGAGQPAEAAKVFDTCLLRMPNRARSLHGAARAHAAAGHTDIAAERFETLKKLWKGPAFANPTSERY